MLAVVLSAERIKEKRRRRRRVRQGNQNPDNDANTFVFNMRFPGQRYDAASGLNQNGYRDYEAATGRYPTSDPVGQLGGINTYAYAVSNPLMWFDPDGLQAEPNPRAPPSTPGPGRYTPPNLPPANDPIFGPERVPGGGVWRVCLNPIVAGIVLMGMPSNIGQPERNCSDDPRKERPECSNGDDDRCAEIRNQCIRGCSDFVLQKPKSKRNDLGGMDFHRCVRQCLDRNDCP